jgi:hypothetical protein
MDQETRFDEIVDLLAPRGVLPGALFGARSLTYDGKAFATFRRERLAVRLGAGSPVHAEALSLEGAEPFDPSGKGRPMKDWVAVPAVHADAWPRLAEAGLDALAGDG